MSEAHTGPICEYCGAPADVHTSDVVAGKPVMRHCCADCIDIAATHHHVGPGRRAEATVLAAVGIVVLLLSASADWLKFGDSEGFGWYQQLGSVVGGLVVFLGAVARAPIFVVIGLLTCLLSLLADWFAFGSNPGFGWQQILGTVIGAGLLLGAVVTASQRREGS